jgi:hypothetical protein
MRGQCGPDRDPLLLAAGQRPQRPVPQVGEAQQVKRFLRPGAHRRRVHGQLLHGVGEFFFDRVGDEPGGRVLPDHADHVGKLARPVPRRVAAVDHHPAGQGTAGEVGDKAVDQGQQRGLTAAGVPDHQAQLAFRDVQVHRTQHWLAGAVVADAHVLEVDHWLGPAGIGGAANPATAATRIVTAGSSGSGGHCSRAGFRSAGL